MACIPSEVDSERNAALREKLENDGEKKSRSHGDQAAREVVDHSHSLTKTCNTSKSAS